MKRCIRWALAILILAAPVVGGAENDVPFDHSALDRVLKAYVDERGQVDYTGLKAHPEDLDAYVALLGRVSPASHPERFSDLAARKAYWINAYNAFVLRGVIDAYPVKSVKDIKFLSGFFNRTYFTAGGQDYTLNNIEHSILREVFNDPRIHAAINCASVGCPRLSQKAFSPENLDAQMDGAMRLFIREPRNVRIDRDEGTVYLSKIFDWFEGDFTGWYERTHGVEEARIANYLRLFLAEEDRVYLESHPDVKVRHADYDWTLNDQALE